MSLQRVLVLAFLVQIVGLVGLVAYLSYRSGRHTIETMAYQLTRQVSARVGDRLSMTEQAVVGSDDLQPLLEPLRLADSKQVLILDASGEVLASYPAESTEEFAACGQACFQEAAIAALQSQIPALTALDQSYSFEFSSTASDPNFLTVRYFANLRPYRDAFNQERLLVVAIPASDFTGVLWENVRQTIIWSGVALLGAIALSLYTTRQLIRPILGLRDAANHFSQGHYDFDIPSTPISEVRQLAFSFREMSNQLQLSFEELQALNADLLAGRTQLEHFLEAIPVGVVVHRADGGVFYMNHAAKRLLGIQNFTDATPSPPSFCYQLYEAESAQLYPAEKMPVTRALHGKHTIADDIAIRRGEMFILAEVRATPIFAEDGQVTHALVVFQDITRRKEAEKVLADYSHELQEQVRARTEDLMQQIQERRLIEANLRQNETTIRAILSAIPDLLLRLKSDGTYLERLSQGELIALSRDRQVKGRNIRDFLPPHLARLRMHYIQQALATGEMQLYEYQLDIDGELHDEECRIVRLADDEVLVIVRNISDRKRAEAALKQSEARKRAILAAIPDLMFRVSREGTLLSYIRTGAFKDLVPEEVNPIGRHLAETLPPEFAQRELQALQRALSTGELQMYEQENWIDGRVQHEEVRVVPSGDDEALFLIRDISDRKHAEQELRLANLQLEQLAQTDGLTQVANRRHFDDRLAREWHRLLHEKHPISLLLFDVDQFKLYNDHYGHQAGDGCLIEIAQAARSATLHPTDFVARYGGEEFALVLPNTGKHGAVIVAQRLQQGIRTLAIPHQLSQISPYVTVSIGISTLVPNAQSSLHDLVVQADQALYAAKQQGRNCYVVFSPDALASIPPHSSLDSAMQAMTDPMADQNPPRL